ncbi:MAG TPA: PDZ domain-containing protein [Phycisphaerae bacterium]|jgi:hypothetical protein
MQRRMFALPVIIAACAPWVFAAEPAPIKSAVAAMDAVAPGLVKVEYELMYSEGQAPSATGWAERCPNCGAYHGGDAAALVENERPLEETGYLVAPDTVVTRDPVIHPRFIRAIRVRYREQVVRADVAALGEHQPALVLALHGSLEGARPIEFSADAQPPFTLVGYALDDGIWKTFAQSLPATTVRNEAGEVGMSVDRRGLIVGADNKPVGLCLQETLPLPDGRNWSPMYWPLATAADMQERIKGVRERCARGILHVSLGFRSPPKKTSVSYDDGDREEVTRLDVLGLLCDDHSVLVLAPLKPRTTARLERITVHPLQGEAVSARFKVALADYGGFVAELETPLEGALTLSGDPIEDMRDELLSAAEISMQGEQRVAYFGHGRIPTFTVGWRRQVLPEIPGENGNLFLFDDDGQLVALPVQRRTRVSLDPYAADKGETLMLPAARLAQILSNIEAYADNANVPLAPEAENRLGWLGVELQPLTSELARANGVSHLTRDGEIGALISFVYPGSPAEDAGLKPGCVLIRLFAEGQRTPIEINCQGEEPEFSDAVWQQYDDLPEEFFDRLPTPWPSAASRLNRALTDLGIGKHYRAECSCDGQKLTKELTVAECPPHFESAPRCISAPLGLTVRNLTYEVRRYFQKDADDPGLIVAKVESGSRASTAGIKPYEIITHVNGKPVRTVADFEAAASASTELSLTVSRMTRQRVVKVDTSAPLAVPTRPSSSSNGDE